MVMSPVMITLGALLAFLTVVFSVVVLPNITYHPPVSDNWLPLTNAAARGRAVYLSNGCMYCHSGFSRPQDVYVGLYYTYPRVSEPGDFRGLRQSPNIFGSARTGPDLSQEGGQHPQRWHVAHYDNPRNTTPISIMPSFRFLSAGQRDDLIAFDESQGGKDAALRNAALTVGNALMQLNMGMQPQIDGSALGRMVVALRRAHQYREGGRGMDKSPSGLPWMKVWMINSFERGYWLVSDPLQVTQQNLIRGKAIFLERCSGCHGEKGDGKGTAAQFLKIKPFDFTEANLQQDPGASSGMMYHRILTAGRGTAMENFGTRLSVNDIWRVVLFLRTIPSGGLKQPLPTVSMYQDWTPSPAVRAYVTSHPIDAPLTGGRPTLSNPFAAAAAWIAPGMSAGDTILVGGKLPVNLRSLEWLVRQTYLDEIRSAYRDARGRGEPLPPLERLYSTRGLQFHAP